MEGLESVVKGMVGLARQLLAPWGTNLGAPVKNRSSETLELLWGRLNLVQVMIQGDRPLALS